jgi:hypothetical protein
MINVQYNNIYSGSLISLNWAVDKSYSMNTPWKQPMLKVYNFFVLYFDEQNSKECNVNVHEHCKPLKASSFTKNRGHLMSYINCCSGNYLILWFLCEVPTLSYLLGGYCRTVTYSPPLIYCHWLLTFYAQLMYHSSV